MKNWLTFFLTLLLIIFSISSFAQSNNKPDEGMDMFVLIMVGTGMCVRFGAAVVGAIVATLFVILIFILAGLGVLTTSFLVALYHRSIAAGFKALCIICFASICTLLGIAGLLFYHTFFPLPVSTTTLCFIGGVSGALGGMLLGLVSFTMLKIVFNNLQQRFIKR